MSHLKLTKRNGEQIILECLEGWRVMEILRDYQIEGIEGICGGACDCASCRVIIDSKWQNRLPQANLEESDKLDELPEHFDGQRLSCQIIWDDSLDGLELKVAPPA
ncbi:MAG: 2Fe-2S iron-sulfur cluster-binding protein [Pseudomonadota bacterium]